MLDFVTKARSAAILTATVLLCGYGVLPLLLAFSYANIDATSLVVFSVLSAASILIGAYLPFGSPRWQWKRLVVDWEVLLGSSWVPFVSFVVVAFMTAEKLPILAALQGGSREEIAVLRENFLKAREGWQSIFVYLSAAFTGAIIPYTLALMFLYKTRLRWFLFAFFLLYSISFLEKGYFLKGGLPFLYLAAQKRINLPFSPKFIVVAIVSLLLGVTIASRAGKSGEGSRFFTLAYVPPGALEFLAWRAVAVPIVTASDAIRVFEERYGGEPLKGATSSLLATAFGLERIPFERVVFAEEWGQNETQTGSANSVFFTEAYVNFGYLGVIGFGLLAGLLLGMFRRSNDEAFRSLWMLFSFGIYTAGLIGLLFSNGFILIFLMTVFVKIRVPTKGALQSEGCRWRMRLKKRQGRVMQDT